MSGKVIEFTEAMLEASAKAYNPSLHEAPLVVGHPKLDAPAYGWAESASYADGTLMIEPHQVDADFAEMVNTGKFKKKSASFYPPEHPSNPVPGVYYIRHIGFLGAQAPSIKGLKDAAFAEEEGLVEFADWDQLTIASMFRRFREWIIAKDGVEEADKIFPNYEIESLQISAVSEPSTPVGVLYSENNPSGDDMSVADKELLASTLAENVTLKAQVTAFSEREAATSKAHAHDENVSFAEGLIKTGKLLPVHKDTTVALLDSLVDQTTPVEFGEGDAKVSKTSLEIYREQLSAAPVAVNFSEVAVGQVNDVAAAGYVSAPGYTVNADALAIHNAALEYAEEHNCEYLVAVKAVEKTV
ncbi:MAG: hypothetical protein ACAH10_09645 [Methylophilaceae bacterium]